MKTKKRKRRSKRKSHKINSKKYRISIHKKNFSDELYKYFKKMKLNPKHNFIDFTTEKNGDKIKFLFTSRINHHYNSDPKWEDIHCKEFVLSDTMIIKTECDKMIDGKPVKDTNYLGFHKVFVKGYHNLYEYIQSIKKNKLDKKDHKYLFDLIVENQNELKERNLINHNLDVKTLHFKYVM